MNEPDHEARQSVGRLEARFDAHLSQCDERYASLCVKNDQLREAIKGLYDRWWWGLTTVIAGMGALLAKDFFV